MGNETYSKKEKEKNRLRKRQEKAEKMEQRKANGKKGKTLEEMMAYIDENGHISSTPPDPRKRKVVSVEDVQVGVPKHTEEERDLVRTGKVTFFNHTKGFGFIKDLQTQEDIFIHVNQLSEAIQENDKVVFEVERGPKGLHALHVKKSN